MKRFIWAILLCCLNIQAFASITDQVVKVNGYNYSPLADAYVLASGGSAVVVDSDVIVTNAHVVTNDSGVLHDAFEICFSYDTTRAPRCVADAYVLAYDVDTDLAVLKIRDYTFSESATISKQTPQIEDSVRIVGFAGNGGESVTLTRGIISGKDQGWYKFDANVDYGNSGGGVFNDAGEFIGIPTRAKSGLTTLGYMVAAEDVSNYLDASGDSQGTGDERFHDRYTPFYTELKNQNISNSAFSLTKLKNYGFTLDHVYTHDLTKSFLYELSSTSQKTRIQIYSTEDSPEDFKVQEEWEDLCDFVGRQNGTYGGQDGYIIYCLLKEDYASDGNFYLIISSGGVTYSVISDLRYTSEIKKSLLMFLKGFKSKLETSGPVPTIFQTDTLTIESTDEIIMYPTFLKELSYNFGLDGYVDRDGISSTISFTVEKMDVDSNWLQGAESFTHFMNSLGNILYDSYSNNYGDNLYYATMFRTKYGIDGVYFNIYYENDTDILQYIFIYPEEDKNSSLIITIGKEPGYDWDDLDVAGFIDKILLHELTLEVDQSADTNKTPQYDSGYEDEQ